MSKDFLLEIGTEPMPARFVAPVLFQLLEKTQAALKENRLGYLDLRASWQAALMQKFGNLSTESRNYFLRDGEHLLPNGERLWAHCVLTYFGIAYEYDRP